MIIIIILFYITPFPVMSNGVLQQMFKILHDIVHENIKLIVKLHLFTLKRIKTN